MLKPYSKCEDSILKHFEVIPIFTLISPQYYLKFYSLTQAVTSQPEIKYFNFSRISYISLNNST